VLLFDGTRRAGVRRLLDAAPQIRELARGGVDVDLVQLFRLGHRDGAPCLLSGDVASEVLIRGIGYSSVA
jgi:hypothetical protein